jgi:predicted RNase H-like nuclease
MGSCEKLCGCHVDLVAIDMPLALNPVTKRRTSDDKVSAAYGGRKCGTHSPSAERPGSISDALLAEFQRAGYALQTTSIASPGLIEVYPHPALVELFSANERLPYKFAKTRSYWPNLIIAERRGSLCSQWRQIVERLDLEIAGVADALVEPSAEASGIVLKAYEDMIDAVICAWVAICALDGKAAPFGDEKSAIWIPKPVRPISVRPFIRVPAGID